MINGARGIIWDWNGTLLDDASLAVSTMNQMLGKRGLPLLSIDSYKSVFTFPVKDYYQGLDLILKLSLLKFRPTSLSSCITTVW